LSRGGRERLLRKWLLPVVTAREEYFEEFTREVNRRRIERSTDLEAWRSESPP
jgi:hypothetical protein